MPYAAGTFSLFSTGNPVVTGTTISSTWANNTLTDIATGLSTAVLKDGTQTITANIPMGGFKFTGLAAGSAAGNSVRWEQTAPGVLTTTGDVGYASSANTLARLAIGALGTRMHSTGTLPEWQGTWFYVGSTTYDVSTASGTQAITGVGFPPKAVIFVVGINGASAMSVGIDDGTNHGCIYDANVDGAGTYGAVSTASIFMSPATSANANAKITALGSDGFTLTWVKVNSPTGTATINFMAFR